MNELSVIDQALAEGKAEGEKSKTINMAKMMLLDKEVIDKIIKYTGLTVKEIQKIKV